MIERDLTGLAANIAISESDGEGWHPNITGRLADQNSIDQRKCHQSFQIPTNRRSIPIPNEIKPTVSRQDGVLIGKTTNSALPTDRVPSLILPFFLLPTLNFSSSVILFAFDPTRYDANPRACD
jgi:hypothetical protein